jgi:hypothetical protein
MQQQSPTRVHRAPVVIDPDAHVSRHVARRTAALIAQTRVWSIDGLDLRQYRAYRAAGVNLAIPRLVRGTVAGHRCQLETDPYGVALGTCDCKAAGHGLRCSHLLALAVQRSPSAGWRHDRRPSHRPSDQGPGLPAEPPQQRDRAGVPAGPVGVRTLRRRRSRPARPRPPPRRPGRAVERAPRPVAWPASAEGPMRGGAFRVPTVRPCSICQNAAS